MPEPTGTGEPVLLAGGGFGEARMATLDERGRVVEYGWGRGSVTSLSVCPGGKNAAELLTRDGQVLLAVRRLPGLQLVSESVVAEMGSGSSVACTASNGSEALAVVASYEQKPEARLLKVTPIGTATLERAAQLSLAVRGKTFFVSLPNGNLVAREGEGARRLIVRAGRHLTGMSVSPDMGFVAGLVGQEIVVADLVRRRTRTLPGISPFGATQWLDTRTLAVASGYGRNGWLELFDPEGRSLRGPLPWGAHATTFRGREAFGVDWAGRLLYTGSSGEPAVRGLLFSPAISTLAALPSP
ncbi:MAG: hypothetical protein H0V45_14110 [Actinobacteria bacterium]|nr:hypothetical protein [Actinomycetota bacterium]